MHVARVEYDPKKAEANLRKHGVSFPDGEGVLRDPLAITLEDGDATSECRFVAIGTGQSGDLLIVVYAEAAGAA